MVSSFFYSGAVRCSYIYEEKNHWFSLFFAESKESKILDSLILLILLDSSLWFFALILRDFRKFENQTKNQWVFPLILWFFLILRFDSSLWFFGLSENLRIKRIMILLILDSWFLILLWFFSSYIYLGFLLILKLDANLVCFVNSRFLRNSIITLKHN